jgi:NADP-dependent 3-hydroxy acid dehydrogenase YdfG
VSNPYLGGEITSTLKPEQVADAVMYVSKLSKNIILKEFTLFPSNEWH